MKISKKICIAFITGAVSFTALYYCALISVPYIVDLNKYKDSVSSAIEKQTGFKVSCEDISFKHSLTPYLKIRMYHTVVLYPDNEIFLKLKDSELKVKILPLIFKKIVIKDAIFERPIINITLYKDFSTSLERYFKPEKSLNSNGYNLDSIIYDTICKNYKLKIKDETINKTFYLEGSDLLIKDIKLNERIHLILKGALKESETEYLTYNIDLLSNLSKPEKSFVFSPFKPILDYSVKGNIAGKLEIAKDNSLKGNLNLNNFELNIDGIPIKDNKAELIFKGEEVDIDSVIHTSKSDNAKIAGKFNYGKKKSINLSAHAKNVNLENLYRIISVVTESLNLPYKLSDIKIKGLANADFSINSDFHKLKSSGTAKLINAEILHNSLPYKINKINSHINFDNNKIIIEQAQAYVNSTPVNVSGKINEDVTLDIKAQSENLDLKTIVNLFFKNENIPINILKGKLSFDSDIKGSLNKSLLINTNVNFNDLSFVEKSLKIPVSIDNVLLKIKNDKNKFSGEILCSNLKSNLNKNPVSSETFKIIFDEKNIQIPQNTVNIMTSPVTLNGSIHDYINKPTGQINFSGGIKSENLAKIISEYIKEPYKAVGILKTNGSLIFDKNISKIKAQINSDKDNYLSFLVIRELLNKPAVLNIDAEINNTISIKDLSLKENNPNVTEPQIQVNGQIENIKDPLFKNVHIIIPDSITVSTNFLGGEEISLNADLIINNTLKNPEIKGNAKIFKYNIKKLLTAVKNADISFSKDNIRIIAPDVQVNTSKFNILADIEPKISEIITVTNAQVNSLNLDLNNLFTLIQNERNPFASSMLVIKKGSATINNFRVLDLKSKDISSEFSLKNNILKMDEISASAYNGNVSGSMNYDINHGALDIKMIGKGLDIKESLYDLCKLEDNFSGKTDFTSSVSLLTGDYNQTLKSLTGRVTFNASNGRMGTLGKFEYYLYAQNILYHGLLNATLNRIADAIAPNNTARFKDAKGSLLFQNGYMITEEIKTSGPNMSLYMRGRHNLLTNQANIDIYGRISDEIKSKLGSFGDVSISELINGQSSKKNVSVMQIPSKIMSNIPDLSKSTQEKTNTFKVNIYGDISSPSAINSFTWTVEKEDFEETLPEFSDL